MFRIFKTPEIDLSPGLSYYPDMKDNTVLRGWLPQRLKGFAGTTVWTIELPQLRLLNLLTMLLHFPVTSVST